MKHLAVYYICTSNYKHYFNDFNESIKYFYPEFYKTIIIISDGLTEYNNYYDKEYNIHYKVKYIDHYPWPINTLFKMQYIYDNSINCDYAFYFNADVIFNKQITNYREFFNLNLLNVTRHGNWYPEENILYDNHIYDFGQTKHSTSYIDDKYAYLSGAIFGGNSKIFFKMCSDINKYVNTDLKYRIIPRWHDESYLNKWCYENKNSLNVNKLFEYDVKNKNKYPFTYLYSKYSLKNKEK